MKNISDNLHLITRTLQGFSIKGEMTRSKSESSMAAAAKYLGVPKSVNKQQSFFFHFIKHISFIRTICIIE